MTGYLVALTNEKAKKGIQKESFKRYATAVAALP